MQSQPELEAGDPSLLDSLALLASRWRQLAVTALSSGLLALGVTYVIAPTYTSATVFLPPQQQQGGLAATALASLGPLAGLAAGAGLRSPGEQFVALLQSHNISDRLIDRFELIKVYDVDLRSEARKELADHVRISLGKKDGLITIVVDDEEPQRAADIANAYVTELRRLTGELALTEAQQRRRFFEGQMQQTRQRLDEAQRHLQASGVTLGSINAEPRAAAEAFARLKAEHTAATVRLQGLRAYLSDDSVEVRQALSAISALQAKLNELAGQENSRDKDSDYLSKYREFKYQETLFDVLSRQLELARVDEARDGQVVQVVDVAQAPDRRSKPKRVRTAALFVLIGLLAGCAWVLAGAGYRRQQLDPVQARRWAALHQAWRR